MRTLASVSFAMFLLAAGIADAQKPCARTSDAAAARFYIEQPEPAPRDSLVVARLCMAPGKKGLGSYLATLTYDTTRMRVTSISTNGGMQVANGRIAGLVRVAGAAPNGFARGPLASIGFAPARRGVLDAITLVIGEASTPAGVSILAEVRATGWQVKPAVIAPPHIDSVSPKSAEVSRERVTDLILYGRGFAPSGNTIVFGGAEVAGLVSESGGTMIRFIAPTELPARGPVATHRIMPGRLEVRVRHAGGASNAVIFVVAGER